MLDHSRFEEQLKMKEWQPLKLEEISEDTKKVNDILNKESDLACVLIGTSYLAELLASIIEVSFIKSSVSGKLLDPQRGALGGFATRTDLAYCLGLINKNVYQDLIKVAEIRNMFAHSHLALDFGDITVREACDRLQAWRILLHGEHEKLPAEPTPKQMQMRARNQFNISVALIGSRIHLNALSKREQSKKP
jgi:DNA-binding MltR family transcriptional regulator